VDVKKLGRIPDGGGHKMLGRAAGQKNTRRGKIGYSYLHNAVDDHSRVAYSEICADEKKETAAAFWRRAEAFFAGLGITVKRVLTDNGSCYRSLVFAEALGPIVHKRTSPSGPRPTARSSGSTAPWSRSGPTPASTSPKPTAPPPTPAGSTTTITTAATPRYEGFHPSAASAPPTCAGNTARPRVNATGR
jgi:hypothetical protein